MKLKDLTLKEKVYRTFILNVKKMKSEGTLREFFDKYPVGGIFFSNGPATDLIEIVPGEAATTLDFLKRCKSAARLPFIVCADGANIEGGESPASTPALGATDSPSLAYDYGRALGMQMNYNGIDWIFAPCVDLSLSRSTETISPMMSDDAEYSAKMLCQVIRGVQDMGVAATVKHFPGLGTHHVNMHISPGRNVLALDEWHKTFGHVYRESISHGVMSVMTSHVSLPSYSERADYGDFPTATYSSDLTLGLLKGELGFDGVVVTDALYMGGASYENQVEEAVAAFAAGADFLLWPPLEAADEIVKRLLSGEIPMSRLDDAIERIQRFSDALGIYDAKRVRPEADADFVDATFREASRRGITLVRNELGSLPLSNVQKNVLVDLIVIESERHKLGEKLAGAEKFCEILEAAGHRTEIRCNYANFVERDLRRETENFDIVIVMLDAPFSIGNCKDCFNSAWTVHLFPSEKKIFLNFSSPYFIDDYYPNEKTFVQVNSELSVRSAVQAAEAILGKSEMTGRLKINVKV